MLGEHAGFIRAYTITGSRSLVVDDDEQVRRSHILGKYYLLTPTTQQEVFRKFSLGIHNLLIATKAVEDLDLPKTTIVIRFVFFFLESGIPIHF